MESPNASITLVRHDAIERLRPVSESAALDVDMLLGEVLGVDRAYLLAHGDQVLTDEQREQFEAWVERAANGEPIAYILGKRGFYDLEFVVTPDVLIPRPETELLLEQALDWARARPMLTTVDVGTGSGALAVTFARHAPQARVYATDVSTAALVVARQNAERHNANVTFLQGDLLSPLIEGNIRVDLVMANLPYIASDEVPTLAVSRYEPTLALDGGADGLDLIRRLLTQIPQACNPNALILLEIGATQGAATLRLVRQILNPQSADVLQDYAGLDRIVRVVW
ncbi:MAG TPA: peptide chain release factor N(5)-glutamine methyltransferase [Oceanobacillus sp.]|nr:peptide chain release factor N(5)-glutamine methyltransferase [Oceanobacillus sp.]